MIPTNVTEGSRPGAHFDGKPNQQSEPLCATLLLCIYFIKEMQTHPYYVLVVKPNTKNTKDLDFKDYKDYWTSDYMKNVRQQMLDGIVPEFCKSCLNIEKTLGYNARRIYNDMARRLTKGKGLKLFVETGNKFNASRS